MIIGVVSDTHGDYAAIERAAAAVGLADLWLHAGDCSEDGRILGKITGMPVISVKGNCDGSADAKVDEFFEAGGKAFWLTHGHRHHVKLGTSELKWWGRQYQVDVIIYGHSHIPEITNDEDLLVVNPGSAAYPQKSEHPTCAVITINDNYFQAKIIELNVK